MFAYAEGAAARGLKAIIAGAGGAAHLPGMLAAKTTVPVLGVPVASRHLQGVDSLHSIVQMPKGIPVATFAIGTAGAANAALFAVAMLANEDAALRARLEAFRAAPDRGRAGDDAPELTVQRESPDAAPRRFIAPGATLGVLGGGQLGRMFVHAAQQTGLRDRGARSRSREPGRPGRAPPHPLPLPRRARPGAAGARAPRRSPPNSRTCRRPRCARWRRRVASRRRPRRSRSARTARREGALRALRRRLRAARGDRDGGRSSRPSTTSLLPGILKTARLGYDGKGQVRVATRAELAAAWRRARASAPACSRSGCRCAHELSVIVARGADGDDGPPAGAAEPAPRRHPRA